jgi:hypothetical protein
MTHSNSSARHPSMGKITTTVARRGKAETKADHSEIQGQT